MIFFFKPQFPDSKHFQNFFYLFFLFWEDGRREVEKALKNVSKMFLKMYFHVSKNDIKIEQFFCPPLVPSQLRLYPWYNSSNNNVKSLKT